MRIALDLDGVLVEWNEPFAQLLGALTGRSFERPNPWPQVWDWPEAAGYSSEEIRRCWEFIQENPDWWLYLPPTSDGAFLINSGLLGRLFAEHDVFVVTNRKYARLASESWLLHHLGVPVGVIDIQGPKGPLLDALQIDVAIDDKFEHLFTSEKVERRVLIDAPYNRDKDYGSIERMSFREIVEELVPPIAHQLFAAVGDGEFFRGEE